MSNQTPDSLLPETIELVVDNIQADGALVFFKDGKRALVREREHPIVNEWVVGDLILVSVAESPVFRMECVDNRTIAHALLYELNEQFTDLPGK